MAESPLPNPFDLPKNYSPAVMAGLKKGMLSGKNKTKMLSTIAGAMFLHKSYPTPDEYDHVCRLNTHF